MKALVAVSLSLSLLTGCGTFMGTAIYGPVPYGGVVEDCKIIERHASDGGLAMIIDLPLSFAVDTALLPVSVPCRLSGVSGK